MRPKSSYSGPWNHQWVRIDALVRELELVNRRQKVWHHFLRTLAVFALIVLYAALALAPETRRALVEASRETFVDVPFDVTDVNDETRAAYRVHGFENIHTEDQFWAWAHDVLHGGVFVQSEKTDQAQPAPAFAEGLNRVLWGIRFRQLRTKHEKHTVRRPTTSTPSPESLSSTPSSSLPTTATATLTTSCDPSAIPPIFADNPTLLASLRCKSGGAVDWATDMEKYDEVDFGYATTREEFNMRGIAVNVTSTEWQWKPSTYDEGIVKIASRLPGHGNYLLDTSGYMAVLPLNATMAREKLFAMQYGRLADSGKPITSKREAMANAAQSAQTKYLSEQMAALFVTLHSYNTGSGYVTRSDFVVERGQEGNWVASFDALAAPLLPCMHPRESLANFFGVILAVVGIMLSLLVINDIRRGGQYLEWWIVVDVASAALLCVHVWWTSRGLVFGVDETRLESSLGPSSSTSSSSSNSETNATTATENLMDSPNAFTDMQYALIWDQATQSILGINLLLTFIRLMSLSEALPLARVMLKAFQSTAKNIVYFLIIYYGMLTAFAVGTMVLLAPAEDGFQTFGGAFINLQRAANGELSIWKIIEPEWKAGGRQVSMLGIIGTVYHIVYMTIFKWLLVEGVLLGLVIDSWVRVYAQEKERVMHEKDRLQKNVVACSRKTVQCPGSALRCLRNHCLPGPRECLSWTCDRCRHPCENDEEEFEAYAYAMPDSALYDDSGKKMGGAAEAIKLNVKTRMARSNVRTRMPIREALGRISAWRSLDINQDVQFVNFKLLSMALSARLPTDHKNVLGRRSDRRRDRVGASHSLTFDDVVWFLEIMVLPYKPRPIEHQPRIYSSEERQAAVLAYHRLATTQGGGGRVVNRGDESKDHQDSKGGREKGDGGELNGSAGMIARGNRDDGAHMASRGTDDNGDGDNSGSALSITALKTLDRALNLMEAFQISANGELEARAKTLLYQNQQIMSRLEALRSTARKLELHAPSLHSGGL